MLYFSEKMHFGADCFSLWFNKLLLLMALIQRMLQKIYMGKLLRGMQWGVAAHLEKHLKYGLIAWRNAKIKVKQPISINSHKKKYKETHQPVCISCK